MKTIMKLSIVIIIFCTLSCSNDNNSSNEENKANVKDIYVCGYEKKNNAAKLVAVVWKNGVATSLTDGTRNANASDVVVIGNDVYVVGYEENNNGTAVAKIWKNGVATNLTDGTARSSADLIEVSGANIYIKGVVTENGRNNTKLWKNNTELFTLPGIGIVIAIAASNNDVYAVGFEGSNAKIWKNDVGTNLTNGNAHSFASDIDIQGNDVYVVGYEVIGNISVAKLWKNGIVSNLSDGNYNASALAISIDGKNVYIYGFETNGVTTSKVWKNGEVIWSKENFSLGDFKAVGEDFYLLNNTGHLAKILKNGVAENLSSAFNSAANALFITTN